MNRCQNIRCKSWLSLRGIRQIALLNWWCFDVFGEEKKKIFSEGFTHVQVSTNEPYSSPWAPVEHVLELAGGHVGHALGRVHRLQLGRAGQEVSLSEIMLCDHLIEAPVELLERGLGLAAIPRPGALAQLVQAAPHLQKTLWLLKKQLCLCGLLLAYGIFFQCNLTA